MTRNFLIFIAIACTLIFARDFSVTPANFDLDISKYNFIDTTQNEIQFPNGNASFAVFFNKMDTLVFENRGNVRILHIGGSHLQADVISGRIREHLVKEYPGASSGRGFVFPYSAARTNTPSSYASYYKGIWSKNKNVQREITEQLGLLGIAVSTSDPRAEITLLLDKYNTTPIWGETRLRLFGHSDNNDVLPILKVDSTDIYGVKDSNSFVFTVPRPIDTIQIEFRWTDSLMQTQIAQFINDSLYNDSLNKIKDSLNVATNSIKKDSTIQVPSNVAIKQQNVALDSMFQGNCDILDTECIAKEEAKKNTANTNCIAETQNADSSNTIDTHCIVTQAVSSKKNSRPRFTLTGILTESDTPGITYTGVGINGAKVHDYFEEVCPLLEEELTYYKPDLVIFAIGINDANVQHFDEKRFIEDYEKLIARIKRVNPNVAIIFETNNDSFRKIRKKRYVEHTAGKTARDAFFSLAQKYSAGVWDKFSLMGGLGSMAKWEKADLAKPDKVHFKLSGYNLLGDLFYKALIKSYQAHIANLPAQEK